MSIRNHILIAEDENHLAKLAIFKLEKEGFRVTWAHDGREAIDLLEREIPDIILLDVMMPRLDGYQTIEEIKKNEKFNRIPVVFLSAKGQQIDIAKGLAMGATDYIVKPFKPSDLVNRVRKILADYEI